MASFTFSCKVKDLGKFEARLGRLFRPTVQEALRRSAQRTVRLLRQMTSEKQIRDMGRFRRGWHWERINWDRVRIKNRAKHWVFVEKGRRRNRRMPPAKPIVAWARRRGILRQGQIINFNTASGRASVRQTATQRRRDEAAVYPIRRAIGKRGIKGRPVILSEEFRARGPAIFRLELRRSLDRALRKAAKAGGGGVP